MSSAGHHSMMEKAGGGGIVEIEYLESTGTQWIDSGIPLSSSVGFEVDGEILTTVSDEYPSLIGVNYDEFNEFALVYEDGGTVAFSVGGYEIYTTTGTRFKGRINYMNDKKLSLSPYTTWDNVEDVLPSLPYNIGIFCAMTENGPDYLIGGARIYGLKITNGTTVVRDFLPYRVGSVGYLFDSVSGQLLGNSGTGAFVLGPDK